MKRLTTSLLTVLILLCQQVDAQPFRENVKTVLFLGNSITYGGSYIVDIETLYTLNHPGHTIKFLNLGLPSETVSGLSEEGHAGGRFPRPDLHERLHRILSRIKPDVVFASYGMNDGIYLPFDESRFKKYREGMTWLHDTLAVTGARVIFITPSVYDEQRGNAKGYAAVLDKYSDWLVTQRKAAGWEIVDVHTPMKKYIEAHRKIDTTFGVEAFTLTPDAVHPGEEGHWFIAQQILLYLGEKNAAHYGNIKKAVKDKPNGEIILTRIAERQGFMKDAWLTTTGHKRPEMNTGIPLPEAEAKAKVIEEQVRSLLK